jgi:2'-5' RNA ligase
MAEAVRTFIAFELPPEVIRSLNQLQDALRKCGLKMRWVRPENIHLTLKFLGNISPDQIEPVHSAMISAASSKPAPKLSARGIGVFPGLKSARVLWVGLSGDLDALTAIQRGLEQRLETIGFSKEDRSFKAHLTLARAKEKVYPETLFSALETCKGFKTGPFTTDMLVLFKSVLEASGAVYTPLRKVSLGG